MTNKPITAQVNVFLPLVTRSLSPPEVIQMNPPYINMSRAKDPVIPKPALITLPISTGIETPPNGSSSTTACAGSECSRAESEKIDTRIFFIHFINY